MNGRGEPAAVEVELRRLRLPLLMPHVTWATSLHDREVILARVVRADGGEGWGECPTFPTPSYTPEYTDAAWAVLGDFLVPRLLGLEGAPRHVAGHPMATGALADARLDAAARGDRLSTSVVLQGRHEGTEAAARRAHTVPTTVVLSGWTSLDDLVGRAAAGVERGASAVKVKLARDLDPLWALRSTFPDLLLAADLNGGYVPNDPGCDALLAEIDRLGLAYLEQPYPTGAGLRPLVELGAGMVTPIALDESIHDLASAEAAVELRAATVLNVKPARVGGAMVAARVVQACVDAGAGAFVGGMLETGVGRGHALAVASLPGCTMPTDLGPSERYFHRDVTEPFVLQPNGSLMVPSGPGIGVVPDRQRLDEVTVDRLVRRR